MITYLYWALNLAICVGIVVLVGVKLQRMKLALPIAAAALVAGWAAYYFHFQQVFVKRYGGVMTVSVPQGQHHVAATWKEDHLWVENYDPATNTCHFNEYSRGNLLQGKVTIKNCNPLIPSIGPKPSKN